MFVYTAVIDHIITSHWHNPDKNRLNVLQYSILLSLLAATACEFISFLWEVLAKILNFNLESVANSY